MKRKTSAIFILALITMLVLSSCSILSSAEEIDKEPENFWTVYNNLRAIQEGAEYIECRSEINTVGNGIRDIQGQM